MPPATIAVEPIFAPNSKCIMNGAESIVCALLEEATGMQRLGVERLRCVTRPDNDFANTHVCSSLCWTAFHWLT
jgi:hypothetical protein